MIQLSTTVTIGLNKEVESLEVKIKIKLKEKFLIPSKLCALEVWEKIMKI